jgi:hypothetical protein
MTQASAHGVDWTVALRRYLVVSMAADLLWEVVQLPLYTLWTTATVQRQAFAVLHCAAGDVMIAGLTLLVALSLLAPVDWPQGGMRLVWIATVGLGSGYTVYSEWLNVHVRGNWAYSELMPTVPIVGTGLSPLLQWLVVPTLALWLAARRPPWAR